MPCRSAITNSSTICLTVKIVNVKVVKAFKRKIGENKRAMVEGEGKSGYTFTIFYTGKVAQPPREN